MSEPDNFVIKRREMPQDNPGSIPGFAAGHDLPFILYFKDSVANTIRAYVNTDPTMEVGGALYGRHYQSADRKQTVVEVNECIPLPSSNRSRAHYTFDAAAIRALRSTKQTSTRYQVGWFHSHPGFGDPFMSLDDIELHRLNFPAPWYVSCVVGGGQYSLPLGFFRIEDGQLVTIDEYFIAMTLEPAMKRTSDSNLITAAGEASRSFVRASVGEERPLHASMGLVRRLLANLGIELSSSLNNYFAGVIERDLASPGHSKTLGAFFHLTELASVYKEDPAIEAELSRIKETLSPVQMFSDAMLLVFATEERGDMLAVWDSRCLFTPRGGAGVIVGDFELNVFTRLDFTSGENIQDLAFSDDRLASILIQSGHLLRVDLNYWETAFREHNTSSVVLPKHDSGVWDQIEAHKSHLYLRDATRIRESMMVGDSNEYTIVKELPAPAGPTLLVMDHQNEQAGLVYQVEGRSFLRFPYDASEEVELNLPSWTQGATMKAAAAWNAGVALLIEREKATMLVTLQRTGELRSVIVQEPDEQTKMSDVTSDAQGRLFVLTNTDVWLLTESGSPDDTWSASRRRKQNKVWRNSLLDPLTYLSPFGK